MSFKSVFENIRSYARKPVVLKSHSELKAQKLYDFHCQRNRAFKFTRNELPVYHIWGIDHKQRPDPKN